jgi:OmcA/MtrC family decaheme c-type cytochrome
VFPADVTAYNAASPKAWPIHMPTGSTTSNKIAYNTAGPASNDPKVAWFPGYVTYTLDPVDDLAPGTYVVDVEIGDRGRLTATSYKTPSVAKKTFQVKTATEEKAPAGNCDTCHQSQSEGMVFDQGRHHKIFDDTAVDQCGACHDYMPQTAVGASWPGAKPISKRVHSVHNGSKLTYPVLTVDHADEPANRFWDITFPQDVRNCETCHSAVDTPVTKATSGSWATKPARLPCSGCHDTDAANSHMKLMTYDPTPANPWSGDEQESCKACH